MKNLITFDKNPYNHIKIIDLIDESDYMKWKILDYHNQKFILDNIVVQTPFTREGHSNFLKLLPTLKRKQYITYFDNRAIGKVSFTPVDYGWDVFGYHLFHENDLGKGYGFLMVAAFFLYGFVNLHICKLTTTVRLFNYASMRILQCLGCRIEKQDNQLFYLICTEKDYMSEKEKVSSILAKKFFS
ncbi:GNAT family N-acetyltransferase [Pectinatus frisingensis]|uniref:GNAT family N-acetyltransferase n=1 Tax=Pectinatus frisingensis TaxID=865 RepID=UPI0018C4DD14